MPYSDDFNQKFEHPQVNNVIVGFSGLDPQRKSSPSESTDCQCYTSTLTEQQKEIVRQIIRDSDTCECDRSSLSDEQKEIIKTAIDERLQDLTFNYDGGRIDDEPEPDPQPLPLTPINEYDLNHEKLSGLLGGDENGRYHLTRDELLKFAAYPHFSEIKHETLPDLLGGDLNGHCHLTDYELRKLKIPIDTFFPDGSDFVIIKPTTPNHDDDDKSLDDYDPYGGLPSGTPPDWDINMLPSDYTIYEDCQKMYYGKHYSSTSSDVLLVPLTYKNNSNAFTVAQSSNLATWKNFVTPVNISSYGTAITDYLYDPNSKYFYFLYGASSIGLRYKGTGGTGSIYNGWGYWNSICYSPSLGFILAASSQGEAVLVSGKKKIADSSTSLTANPACAAWHPVTAVFCLTGREGTSTSFDGETWTLNRDTPHDLRELSYREDLGFVAWSGEDKTFYASNDGINWTQLSDTPIPLENISAVHYEPSRQWYCAVGINDGYAYFSKDLKHWIPTRLRNNSPVDVGDVIYMPSTGLYVAMPTSGNYFYTFNPSNWTD